MKMIMKRRTWLLLALVACGEEECTFPTDVDPFSTGPSGNTGPELVLAPRTGGIPYRTLLGDSVEMEARVWDYGFGPPLPPSQFAWTSSDSTVAAVTPDGLVVTLREGKAAIGIRSPDAPAGTPPAAIVEVIVLPISALQALAVYPDSTSLQTGEHVRVGLYGSAAEGPMWLQGHCSSSDSTTAAIDSSGIGPTCRVRGGMPGRATLTMTTNAGRSAAAIISVRATP